MDICAQEQSSIVAKFTGFKSGTREHRMWLAALRGAVEQFGEALREKPIQSEFNYRTECIAHGFTIDTCLFDPTMKQATNLQTILRSDEPTALVAGSIT